MSRGAPHTSAPRGKKVIVTLKNGDILVDKFKEHHDRYIVMYSGERINTRDIRAMTIYRGQELL